MASCANTQRVLSGDQRILYNNDIIVHSTDSNAIPSEIEAIAKEGKKYLRQTPKNGFLNIYHSILNTYYWTSPSDSSWWARTMRTLGKAPTIYSEVMADQSAKQLQTLMDSRGCFRSSVTIDTQHISHQRISTTYHINAQPRYIIDEVIYTYNDTAITSLVNRWRETSSIHVGDYYDQQLLVDERTRMANWLQYSGFYMTSADLIHYVLDTTYATQRLSIEIIIDNPRNQQHEKTPFQRYYIDQINIDSNSVNENTIRRVMTITERQRYSPFRTTSTYNSLLNLRNFNIINIDYEESPRSHDTLRLLNANVRLHNSSQQRLSASLEISNASPLSSASTNSGNFGAETVLQYQHKNLFGGAEILSISGNFLVELNKSVLKEGFRNYKNTYSALETGITLSLDLPAFWLPYGNRLAQGNTLPHTLIDIGFDRQYRTYFERRQVNTSYGYTWSTSRQVRHKLYPIGISYVQFPSISEAFARRLANVLDYRLAYQYSDHLIINFRYDFTFSDQRIGRQTNFSYFNATVETAGNAAAAIATMPQLRQKDNLNETYQLMGVSYAQYIRFNAEYKYYMYHTNNGILVARAIVGVGVPYGNSATMPYEKSFFGGGPNNIRAWQIRHLGPGHYHSDNSQYDMTGDIALVFNIEERFPIVGPLEGALFSDAGNVWFFRRMDNMPGANFNFKNLLTDMALGVGIGLRLKISILTLRLDLAVPIHDPNQLPDQRWIVKNMKLNNINTNFGIDYPF